MKIAVILACLFVTCMAKPQERIVNGAPADPYVHPHMASLQLKYFFFGYSHICGAVLIGPRTLLTAAHCLDGNSPSNMRVVVGVLNLQDATSYRQTINVARVVMHENYQSNSPGIPNDIGLIFLASDVEFNRMVQPAELAPKGSSYADELCVLTGWGQLSGSGSAAQNLKEVHITKITEEQCRTMWPDQNINKNHICVFEESVPSGDRPSACMGDSGGPMMCGEGYHFLAGITSWGVRDCSGDYPSVYTRVSEYIDWVQANS